jgi:hypothetical protein
MSPDGQFPDPTFQQLRKRLIYAAPMSVRGPTLSARACSANSFVRTALKERPRDMMLLVFEVFTVFLTAIAMSLAPAHALEYPGKLRLDEQAYAAVQAIYYPGFTIGGIAEPMARYCCSDSSCDYA